ncbi:hypothetical protein ACLQ3K_20660 [Tsukamurella sp. DT100]|uniref:hypothetical protein n=1 Tax=Tsukamurella sp. DT100 TaxID=3393415 RepID=UPI003CF8D1D8
MVEKWETARAFAAVAAPCATLFAAGVALWIGLRSSRRDRNSRSISLASDALVSIGLFKMPFSRLAIRSIGYDAQIGFVEQRTAPSLSKPVVRSEFMNVSPQEWGDRQNEISKYNGEWRHAYERGWMVARTAMRKDVRTTVQPAFDSADKVSEKLDAIVQIIGTVVGGGAIRNGLELPFSDADADFVSRYSVAVEELHKSVFEHYCSVERAVPKISDLN